MEAALPAAMKMLDIVEEFWDDGDLERAMETAAASGPDPMEAFESNFLDYLGSNGSALFVESGRAALFVALSLLPDRPEKFVLVPAYCCEVVGEAILRAGMRPLLVDSGRSIGEVDWEGCFRALNAGGVAAMVVPHLFGCPVDFRQFEAEARPRGVVLIEDCAHCLGGRIGERMAGSLGEFSIFSFNFDKAMSLGGGGMLVVNTKETSCRKSFERARAEKRSRAPARNAERESLGDFRLWLEARRSGPPPRIAARLVGLRRLARRISGPLYPYARKAALKISGQDFSRHQYPVPRAVGALRAALGGQLLERYPAVLVSCHRNK